MLIRIILLLALLFLPACSWLSSNDTSAGEPTPIPTSVVPSKPTYEVKAGDVLYKIEFRGRVAAVAEMSLTFPMDGLVGEVYVKRGSSVQAGDPIARLDVQALEKELLLANSELEVASERLEAVESQLATEQRRMELKLAMAELNVEFARSQAGEEPTAEEAYQIAAKEIELELAQLALDEVNYNIDPLLRSEVEQAALRVAELESLLEKTTLLALADGQITSLDLSVGQLVNANQSIGTIADVTRLEVSASLREPMLEQMTEQMPATITINNRPSEVFPATVRRLPRPYGSGGSNAELEPNDESVRITFDDAKDADSFELGALVEITSVVTQREDVLWLPPAAIRTFSGRNFVVIQENGTQRRIDVELGIEGQGRVEIKTGIEKGQTVIGP